MGTVASEPDRRAIVTSPRVYSIIPCDQSAPAREAVSNQRRHGEPSPFSGRRLAGEIRQLGWARPFALAFSAGIGRDFLWPCRIGLEPQGFVQILHALIALSSPRLPEQYLRLSYAPADRGFSRTACRAASIHSG